MVLLFHLSTNEEIRKYEVRMRRSLRKFVIPIAIGTYFDGFILQQTPAISRRQAHGDILNHLIPQANSALLNIFLTFSNILVAFINEKVTLINILATFINEKVTLINILATFINEKVTLIKILVTFINEKVSLINILVTFINEKVTLINILVTFINEKEANMSGKGGKEDCKLKMGGVNKSLL